MRLLLTIVCLFFCFLLPVPAVFAIVTLDTTFSWSIWQDLDGDSERSSGETVDLTSQNTSWQVNGSYSNNLSGFSYLNPTDPSTGYVSGGDVPINGLSESFALSGGSGATQSALSGDSGGAALNVSTSASMPSGTVGARYDNISINTSASTRFDSSMFDSGVDGVWSTDDATIHFSLLLTYSIFDPDGTVWAENIELQGAEINISRLAYGYENVDGVNTFRSIELPGTWTFQLDSTGTGSEEATQTILADFEFNPAQEGETWNNFGWLFEFDTFAWASYYQPEEEPLPNPDPVPEPSTLFLLGSGLIGLTCYQRKRRK